MTTTEALNPLPPLPSTVDPYKLGRGGGAALGHGDRDLCNPAIVAIETAGLLGSSFTCGFSAVAAHARNASWTQAALLATSFPIKGMFRARNVEVGDQTSPVPKTGEAVVDIVASGPRHALAPGMRAQTRISVR